MPKLSFKNEIIRNCTTLLSGTAIAQCVTFLAYPVIARLFSSEDFGIYTTILSYIDILVILSTARYDQAIMISKDINEVAAIAKLCRILCLIVTALVTTTTCLIIAFSQTSKLDLMILFIPLLVFFSGQYRIYTILFNKYKEFKRIAVSEITTGITGAGLKIISGIAGLFKIGLPLATVLGRIAGNATFYLQLRKKPLPKTDKATIIQMMKKHKNFPLFTMPKDFINSFSINLPFTLLAIYFDQAFIGLFSMAFTFTFRPMNILNSAYDKVLYERISTKYLNGQPILKDIVRFFSYNYLVAIPLFIIAFIFAEPILTLILGQEWSGTATYFRYMIPWIGVMLISSSISFVPYLFNKQRNEALLYALLFVIRLVAIIIGIYHNDFDLAIMLFCGTGTIFTSAITAWYIYMAYTYDKKLSH